MTYGSALCRRCRCVRWCGRREEIWTDWRPHREKLDICQKPRDWLSSSEEHCRSLLWYVSMMHMHCGTTRGRSTDDCVLLSGDRLTTVSSTHACFVHLSIEYRVVMVQPRGGREVMISPGVWREVRESLHNLIGPCSDSLTPLVGRAHPFSPALPTISLRPALVPFFLLRQASD